MEEEATITCTPAGLIGICEEFLRRARGDWQEIADKLKGKLSDAEAGRRTAEREADRLQRAIDTHIEESARLDAENTALKARLAELQAVADDPDARGAVAVRKLARDSKRIVSVDFMPDGVRRAAVEDTGIGELRDDGLEEIVSRMRQRLIEAGKMEVFS